MDHDEMEKLKTINGVQLFEDDTMEIQVAFDGEVVTFRHEDGSIQSMGILCYLHFVLTNCIEEMTDDGILINEGGITPGHVIGNLIDHLHEQHHELMVNRTMSEFSNMMGGVAPDDKEMVVLKMGKDGIEEIPLSELPNEIAKMKAAENIADMLEGNDSDTDSDEDEITVLGTRNDPKRHH